MRTLTKVIEEVMKNPVVVEMNYKNKNLVELSGYILVKPKFIKHDRTGIESCSFILFQLNNRKGVLNVDSFSCMCYVKELIEQFKTLDKVIYVAALGQLRYSKIVKNTYTQVGEIKTLFELDDDLADEWGKLE